MKTVDDHLTDMDQDLADSVKAFRQAEDLLQRGRRRLISLMGAARALGLRGDEPPVWAEVDGQFYGAQDQAVADWIKQPGSGHTSQASPKAQPLFFCDRMRTADLLDLLALSGIDVRREAKPHLVRLGIDVPPDWPNPMPAAPVVNHPNCRCVVDLGPVHRKLSDDPLAHGKARKRGAKVPRRPNRKKG